MNCVDASEEVKAGIARFKKILNRTIWDQLGYDVTEVADLLEGVLDETESRLETRRQLVIDRLKLDALDVEHGETLPEELEKDKEFLYLQSVQHIVSIAADLAGAAWSLPYEVHKISQIVMEFWSWNDER